MHRGTSLPALRLHGLLQGSAYDKCLCKPSRCKYSEGVTKFQLCLLFQHCVALRRPFFAHCPITAFCSLVVTVTETDFVSSIAVMFLLQLQFIFSCHIARIRQSKAVKMLLSHVAMLWLLTPARWETVVMAEWLASCYSCGRPGFPALTFGLAQTSQLQAFEE